MVPNSSSSFLLLTVEQFQCVQLCVYLAV